MRQLGQQAAGVAGGDPVAVGVLDVVQRAVGVVGRDLAVQLGQRVAAAGNGRQRAVVAGLGEVTAAAIGLEAAQRAGRAEDVHRAVGIDGERGVPRVGPAPAESAELVPRDDTRARMSATKLSGSPGEATWASVALARLESGL